MHDTLCAFFMAHSDSLYGVRWRAMGVCGNAKGVFHGTPEDSRCHHNPWQWSGPTKHGAPLRRHITALQARPAEKRTILPKVVSREPLRS